jgi:hypothetical protein
MSTPFLRTLRTIVREGLTDESAISVVTAIPTAVLQAIISGERAPTTSQAASLVQLELRYQRSILAQNALLLKERLGRVGCGQSLK